MILRLQIQISISELGINPTWSAETITLASLRRPDYEEDKLNFQTSATIPTVQQGKIENVSNT